MFPKLYSWWIFCSFKPINWLHLLISLCWHSYLFSDGRPSDVFCSLSLRFHKYHHMQGDFCFPHKSFLKRNLPLVTIISRADSQFAPSQWEMLLQSNALSHWLGANLESALISVLDHFACQSGLDVSKNFHSTNIHNFIFKTDHTYDLEENFAQILLPNWQFFLPLAIWQWDMYIFFLKSEFICYSSIQFY